MKIISIDPSYNGATAFIVADYEQENIEPIVLTNFGILDFKQGEDNNFERLRNKRAKLLENFIEFIVNEEPDLVIIENFIQYRVQMGQFGQTFPTSEMIGVVDYMMRLHGIPLVRTRASDLRLPTQGYYESECRKTGEIRRVPKPRKFKPNLTNKALKERGFLVSRRYNRTHLVINGEEYCLSDYKVGKKNDHALMALKHLINWTEKHNIYKEISRIETAWKEENE